MTEKRRSARDKRLSLAFSPDHVTRCFEAFYNVSVSVLVNNSDTVKDAMWLRHVYSYCLFQFTSTGVVQIGELINRNHNSVRYSVITVFTRCRYDLTRRHQIFELETIITG